MTIEIFQSQNKPIGCFETACLLNRSAECLLDKLWTSHKRRHPTALWQSIERFISFVGQIGWRYTFPWRLKFGML